ncbi:cleavage and polyadenylation specificity factor subunit 4-like isoform X3 [Scyliorhinus canicula]|uniref:cleavage and polyadenylation specificity factor subunit 4-like isoform X3 n=1 Tax=Scyliorhinus canicula TaxID=7830 RepID=UPI0018F7A3C1|nr:cleavage and polyadenylation specificity factor subunit 4-like isoform X3 [Scyliorhinus canicula]
MQELIADLQKMRFDFEIVLEQQRGMMELPFSGMDKSSSAVCELFIQGKCSKEEMCPFRHLCGDKTIVCKHWLRGLCKKGDQCEFLHEYDEAKMPRCYFYSKFGECNKQECPFLHIDSQIKIHDCPWYDRGFCKHGPLCKNKHTRKIMCVNYSAGFCPEGTACKLSHPIKEFTEWNSDLSKFHSPSRSRSCAGPPTRPNHTGTKSWPPHIPLVLEIQLNILDLQRV